MIKSGPTPATRIALSLNDPSADLRSEAATGIEQDRRAQRALAAVERKALAVLLEGLRDPAKAEAIASFLYDYVTSDRARAEEVLSLATSTEALGVATFESLVGVCREQIEGRHLAACSICRGLGASFDWAIRSETAPPEFARLKPLQPLPINPRDMDISRGLLPNLWVKNGPPTALQVSRHPETLRARDVTPLAEALHA